MNHNPSPEEIADATAIKVGMGAAAGVATGLAGANAALQIHNHAVRPAALNASSNFVHGATKALKQHKGLHAAIGAGAVAAFGTGAAATVATVAAPVALVAAAGWGIFKLAKYIKENS